MGLSRTVLCSLLVTVKFPTKKLNQSYDHSRIYSFHVSLLWWLVLCVLCILHVKWSDYKTCEDIHVDVYTFQNFLGNFWTDEQVLSLFIISAVIIQCMYVVGIAVCFAISQCVIIFILKGKRSGKAGKRNWLQVLSCNISAYHILPTVMSSYVMPSN